MIKPRVVVLLTLALPLLLYIPHLQEFAYPFGSQHSDLTISHYPNALFIKNSLNHWGQIPLWSNAILSGYPFIANPLSGLLYPPGWLPLVLESPLAFNITILFHILWGGIGMYRFLNIEIKNELAAVLGAAVFELMPKIFGHYAAGHITLVYAISWTPWLFFFQKNRSRIGVSLTLAILMLADIRWAFYCGLLWAGYFVFGSGFLPPTRDMKEFPAQFLKTTVRLFGKVVLAISLAAPLLLPFLEYVSLSTRRSMGQTDSLFLSMSPLSLIGLIVPDFGAYAEWLIYPGSLAVMMVFWVLLVPELRRKYMFWLMVIGLSILLSLGENFPLTSWIFSLPGFNMLRVPSRLMLIGGFAAAVLVCAGMRYWLENGHNIRNERALFFWITLPILVSWILTLTINFINSTLLFEFLWGSIAYSGLGLIFWLYIKKRVAIKIFLISIILMNLVDITVVGYSQFDFRSSTEVTSEGSDVAEFLQSHQVNGRIFSTTYDLLPQHQSAIQKFEMASGVDPLQLASYITYLEKAIGINMDQYSVVVPPMVNGEDPMVMDEFIPDEEMLARLNIEYVISEKPIDEDFLSVTGRTETAYIYMMQREVLRARVSTADRPEMVRCIENFFWSPNYIEVVATGPGRIILSEINYPGWIVYVDGVEKNIIEIDGLFRSVDLGPGVHNVAFVFRPITLVVGLVIQAVVLSGIIGFWLIYSFRKHMTENSVRGVSSG